MSPRSVAATFVATGLAVAGAFAGDGAQPAFSREEYFALVRRYARGERAEAVAGLGAWSERDLARQLSAVEQLARAAERCPDCPNSLQQIPLKAAVMLHWDRDRAEQPGREGVEQRVRCPGPMAELAGRLARVLARRESTAPFARRFFRLVVATSQWDACFEIAERWATQAIEIFPKDAPLLLARGCVREEVATLTARMPRSVPRPGLVTFSEEGEIAAARKEGFEAARRDFEDALRIEPGVPLAQVRLGRVLWRLGEPARARQLLEAAVATGGERDHVYLAHLFLGRLHQDDGRLGDAALEYERAAELHPSALSAGVALSHALLMGGDHPGARRALAAGLRSAGRRSERDPLWDYLVGNAIDHETQSESLHRETLE